MPGFYERLSVATAWQIGVEGNGGERPTHVYGCLLPNVNGPRASVLRWIATALFSDQDSLYPTSFCSS